MDKKLLALFSVFVLTFIGFMMYLFFNKQFVSLTQANSESISQTSTLVFAWPLSVKANGVDTSVISAFIQTTDGKPVKSKVITARTTLGSFQRPTQTTNADGKVEFMLQSERPGIAEISILVNNVPIQRKISVDFQ